MLNIVFRLPPSMHQVNDTVMFNIETGKITDFVKFDVGNICMATGGHNNGRVGTIVAREKHKGSFEIVHIEDAAGNRFATRITNVFVIGKGNKSLISLPKVRRLALGAWCVYSWLQLVVCAGQDAVLGRDPGCGAPGTACPPASCATIISVPVPNAAPRLSPPVLLLVCRARASGCPFCRSRPSGTPLRREALPRVCVPPVCKSSISQTGSAVRTARQLQTQD